MKENFDLSKMITYLLLCASFITVLFLHKNVVNLEIQGAHAWRQCQTMWNVRNFVRHDANILNPRVSSFNGGKENILRYEFPLMQYAIAMAEKVFGEDVVVVRFCLFLLAIFTSFGFFYLVRDIFDHNLTALLATIFFQLSPVFYYYSWNPIPDNLALCGAIWYLVLILRFDRKRKLVHLVLASLALLVATLAKLPFLMFAVVSIHLYGKYLLGQFFNTKTSLVFPLIQLLLIIPAFLWYSWVMPTWAGNSVLVGIFENPLSRGEYMDIITYHLDVMFPKLLTYPSIWIFALLGLVTFWMKTRRNFWMISLMGITFVYLVLELNAINMVHDYYMLPFLPWIYIMVAAGVFFTLTSKYKYLKILPLLAVIIAPIDTSISTNDKWGVKHDGFNPDVYKNRKLLQDIIPDDELCIILNDRSKSVFSYNIDKMGHVFYHDDLPILWIGDMIDNHGLTHMYSDSRIVDQDPEFDQFVDALLLNVGSVNVYKLRDPITDTIKYLPDFKRKKQK